MTDAIIGESPCVQQLRERILRVAQTEARVLILGENGTGKELIANAIHQASTRSARTMVSLNCAAVPSELIESELFGYNKGAFTGAHNDKKGRFELANEGTLFLDEVGDMPLPMQGKLLRVLQEGTFERVGGRDTIQASVRVLSATNKDLHTLVGQGRFREDLYYRLAVLTLTSPPLRERTSDIPALVRHFISKGSRPTMVMSAEALQALAQHPWPGNIRELVNVVERLAVLSPDQEVAEDLVREALRMDEQYREASGAQQQVQGRAAEEANKVPICYVSGMVAIHSSGRKGIVTGVSFIGGGKPLVEVMQADQAGWPSRPYVFETWKESDIVGGQDAK